MLPVSTASRCLQLCVLAALVAVPAVAGGFGPCPPEWQPAFPVDATAYPFGHNCIELSHGTLHYVDEAPADPRGTVLMLHGNPTWSFLYRDIAQGLLDAGFRVVAPDLYGFGLSDKPSLDLYGYTPAEHAQVIEAFIATLDLDQTTLVIQDWGGPIGVAAVAAQSERISALVIMNTWVRSMDPANPGVFHRAVDFSLDNIDNPDAYLDTGKLAKGTGLALAELHGPVGSPEYLAVRDAYWGPFLDIPSGDPLGPEIVAPTNIFAQNLTLDPGFLDGVDQTTRTSLVGKPAYVLYGGADNLFGHLLCDPDGVELCPGGGACVPDGDEDVCVDDQGEIRYPMIEHLRSIWDPARIVGELVFPDSRHMVQEVQPDAIVAAIETVAAAAAGGVELAAPVPSQAGAVNTLTVSGAPEGHVVVFLAGLTEGQRAVPGCGGVGVNVETPIVLGFAVADASGSASIDVFIPQAVAGLEVRVQAVDRASCVVSNVRFADFR
jgi:pimeloyl-ACP methyl ester carboxylesterase